MQDADMEDVEAGSSMGHSQRVGLNERKRKRETEDVPEQTVPDTDVNEDKARSEATFRYAVHNFSELRELQFSPPFYVRNLPWRIKVMPRISPTIPLARTLGFFLQCGGEAGNPSWSCLANVELRLIAQRDGAQTFSRRVQHLFNLNKTNVGFIHFLLWNDVLDPEKGYIKDDTILLEVHVAADLPQGVSWECRKHTGYVGLKCQEEARYLNSILQALYFNNQLRKVVYKIPTESDDASESVALALQQVFYELQFREIPASTRKLVKSFGWTTYDYFQEHGVQEFLRMMLDKLEDKMRGTCIEGIVPKLFEGKMLSIIKCKNIDYSTSQVVTFYDIQLNVKGKKNIVESFNDYVKAEVLGGDNKYDAGELGLQEAEKRVIFTSFPPVLHLQLSRPRYDPATGGSLGGNDRFEFEDKLNLSPYLQTPEETSADYTLQAVLVRSYDNRSNDNHSSRHTVFVNPKGDGNWYKFDDGLVSKSSKQEAVDGNYGGRDGEIDASAKRWAAVYMLVYIRDSELDNVLQEVTQTDIPDELVKRLQEEKRLDEMRRKEREEAHLYMKVQVLLEDSFDGHQGNDLFDPDKVSYKVFRIKKNATLGELMEQFAEAFKCPVEQLRPWPLALRPNHTLRPIPIDLENDLHRTMQDVSQDQDPWMVFLECVPPDSGLLALPPYDKDSDVLLFFKMYDPNKKRIHYCGHHYVPVTSKLQDLIPMLNVRAGFPPETELSLFEEISPRIVDEIKDLNIPLEKDSEDFMDGDIIVFQKKPRENLDFLLLVLEDELPTCRIYFRHLYNQVEVTFCDITNPDDPGISVELKLWMTYDMFAEKAAQRIGTAPDRLRFFKTCKDDPDDAIKSSFKGNLKNLLILPKLKRVKKLYYQKLNMPVIELENKEKLQEELRQMKEKVGALCDMLKCPVCWAIMQTDSVLCVNGHSVCQSCRLKVKNCPSCRARFSNVRRNAMAGQVLEIVSQKCEHENCPEIVTPGDDHETYCCYRSTYCQICRHWEGPVNTLIQHFRCRHKSDVLVEENPRVVFSNFDFDEYFSKTSLYSAHGHYIWEVVYNNPRTGMLGFRYYPVLGGNFHPDISVRLCFKSRTTSFDIAHRVVMSEDEEENAKGNTVSIHSSMLTGFWDKERLELAFGVYLSVAND